MRAAAASAVAASTACSMRTRRTEPAMCHAARHSAQHGAPMMLWPSHFCPCRVTHQGWHPLAPPPQQGDFPRPTLVLQSDATQASLAGMAVSRHRTAHVCRSRTTAHGAAQGAAPPPHTIHHTASAHSPCCGPRPPAAVAPSSPAAPPWRPPAPRPGPHGCPRALPAPRPRPAAAPAPRRGCGPAPPLPLQRAEPLPACIGFGRGGGRAAWCWEGGLDSRSAAAM